MSNYYSIPTGMSHDGGIHVWVDEIGEGSIDRARKLLAGYPHGFEKAVGSAIKRAANAGEAYAARAVNKEYVLNVGDFKKYTKSKKRYYTSGGCTTVEVEYRGVHIPLLKFDTRMSGSGRVTTRVKRASARKILDHAFHATVGGHTGIFERETERRFPISEIVGPSGPQMMTANEQLNDEIGEKIHEVFDARIDHEILAVLNGWR